MRRRSKRGPNLSESTGKIGQELPSNQPAPLVPFYPEEPAAQSRQGRSAQSQQAAAPPQTAASEQSRRSAEPRPAPSERAAPSERPPRAERPVRPQPMPSWNEPPGSGRLEVETQPELPSVPPPEAQPAD